MYRKSFKYRLYPNKEQAEKLQWTLDRCRNLYNAALDERKSAAPRFIALQQFGHAATLMVEEIADYPKNAPANEKIGFVKTRMKSHAHHSVTKVSQSRQLTEIKHEIDPEYQHINDHILRNVLDRVDKAFDAFFRRVKAGQTPGYPRFQGRNRYDSFTTNNGFKIKDGRISLQYIGLLKVKIHRPIEGKVKTCTIKREGEHWYVTFVCEVEEKPYPGFIDDVVGIDVGLNTFATLSNGEGIPNPCYYRKTEEKLKQAGQELSRKKQPHGNPKGKAKGKNPSRRQKALRRVAKLHKKIARQRRDFLHKASRKLVDTHETLVFEDLQIANMERRPKPKQDEATGHYVPNGASAKAGLNKSISDAGWGMFVEFCTYKAEWAGRAVLKVNPKNTSQACSRCKEIVPKTLEERIHRCPHCGLVIDRDVNAALNIRTLGMNIIAGQGAVNDKHPPPQKKNEAGSASAFGLPYPLKKRRASRAAESPVFISASQASLWDGQ